IGHFVEQVSRALNCQPDFAAVPLLALAGGAIGNTRRLRITASHDQGAVLFVISIGRPGSGKSPAQDKVVEPLEEAEGRHGQEWKAAVERGEAEDKETRGPRPVQRRLLVDDCTTEVLADILAQNPRGVLMIREEAAAIVTGANQYKGGKGHDR